MPIFNVRNIGSLGVNSDIAPWDLPDNALSDGRNFRVVAGKIQAAGGSSLLNPEKLSSVTWDAAKTTWDTETAKWRMSNAAGEQLGHIDQAIKFNGDREWVVCGDKSIFRYDGVNFDTLYTGAEVDPSLWSTCKIGRVIFFNHPDLQPMYRSGNEPTESPVQPLPWSPVAADWDAAKVKTNLLASHRNFLFALGTTEVDGSDTNYYTDRVRWSHPVEPNGIPYTWEPANDDDKSSLAGYVTLGRGGQIVGGESMRDSFVIYSAEALNVLDYTGDALMWRRRTVSQTAGLIGKEAVTEVRGQHFFMAYDDIITFDGNQATSLLHNRLRKKYASAVDMKNAKNSFTVHNKTFNEIWFCFPEKGAEFPNVAYVFNYRDGSFSIRDLSLAEQFRHGHFGSATRPEITWGNMKAAWDTERSSWSLGGRDAFDGLQLGCAGEHVYNMDTQYPDEDITTFIERTHVPVAGHDNTTTVTRVYPQVEGSTPIKISVGSHQSAGDSVRWSKPNEFNPVTDRKVDSRATGELHAFRVEGKADGNFNFTGFDVEYAAAGKR